MKKIEVKTYTTTEKFEAFDGRIFDTEDQCKKYENIADKVIEKDFMQYIVDKISEWDFKDECGSEDWYYALVDIKDEAALNAINTMIVHHDKNRSIIPANRIGQRVIITMGYPNEYDCVGYCHGTEEEYIQYMTKRIHSLYNPEENKKEG